MIKLLNIIFWVLSLALFAAAPGLVPAQDEAEQLRAGAGFIPTKVYTLEEDLALLKYFDGLRVSDIIDGMDQAGLRDVGLMDQDILPLWKDAEHFTHRIVGVAVTARYVPTNKPLPKITPDEFHRWEGEFYSKYSSEPFMKLIRKGTVLVIDDVDDKDIGTIGSNNIMGWKAKGMAGVVTDACARDTDEIITEKIPLYFRKIGRGIRPGRNEIESVNRPINCGGVLVMPGDIVAADGEGVIVVPREHAKDVAQYARLILEQDKEGRRGLYKQLNLPEDDSVK
ncbi:MAG: RraA family protein [Candidatus Omnitrophota bacterium]